MSIEQLTIRNWQSLRRVDLVLGRLTVVVGASSSGKSALVRAIRAVSSGMRGSASITRGAKTCAITVHTDTHIVTLERGATSGLYRVVDRATGAEDTFTKLAGAVPEQITAALRLHPAPTGSPSLNIAAQFDAPFLLDDTGAAVARVLGELTQANLLLEAVRAAHKARHSAAAAARARTADLEDLRAGSVRYGDLALRRSRCQLAELVAERATELTTRIDRLRQAITALADTAHLLAAPIPPAPPTVEDLTRAAERHRTYTSVLRTWLSAERDAATAQQAANEADIQARALHEELHTTLRAAGTCPTCGQNTRNQ